MKKIYPFTFYLIEILFLEIVCKYLMIGHIFDTGLLYTLVFSVPIALILSFLTTMFKNKLNKVILFILSFIIIIYFEFQYIFYNLFSVAFSFSTIELANQALDFTNIIIDAITKNIIQVLIMLIPFILLIIFNKRINCSRNNKYQNFSSFLLIIMALSTSYIYLLPNKDDHNSAYYLYKKVDDQMRIINEFGLLTYTKIDISRLLFGYEVSLIPTDLDQIIEEPTEEEITYGANVEDINFEELINNETNEKIISMHDYFNKAQPSYKNEYTGMFKDKNLIFILAEGFNEVAVDQNRTPTLYKLIHEGFNFTNFYSPVFLSTTGGEFQATTGLIPTQEILSAWKNKAPNMLYSLGNSFTNVGYTAQAYHNWTYTYYKRHVTMKTLGFNNYMGCGNGMEDLLYCGWLPSDIKMMEQTSKLYTNKEKFVTYYVTVSGHSPYEKGANIVNKHYNTVKDLDISSGIKNYLSSQVELDKALEQLINDLQVSGKLENTVIALVGDHYPYTLSADEINEVSSYKKDGIVEVNHSNFIIWNSGMTPVTIDKVGSQIDVLPTLLNLFGVEYDSRLITGKDILSTYDGLAIFSNRSWVTDYGTYYAASKKFVPKEGVEVPEDYVQNINNRVSNTFVMSKLLVENNYYNKIKSGS